MSDREMEFGPIRLMSGVEDGQSFATMVIDGTPFSWRWPTSSADEPWVSPGEELATMLSLVDRRFEVRHRGKP